MSNNLQPIRGMKDLMPEDYQAHISVVHAAQDIANIFGYRTIATPIVEHTSVFTRTLGDTSEVVSKEMYSFLDRSNESITLRPEFTAGVMRSFISNGLHHQIPLRFFSHGPVFRYDRPQAGRQRQFHQINFEHLGADGPYTDAEVLKMAQMILQKLDLMDDITLELNSIGCDESRANYISALKEYFSKYKSDLSPESQARLEKNPLRILDSKSEQDKKLIPESPVITDYYSQEAKKYFEDVLDYAEVLGVKYVLNPRLVRGLDYYAHTAFEFTTEKLGAQSTVIGGGRYDGLSKLMGGPQIPAIGFGGGIERLVLLRDLKKAHIPNFARPIVVVPIGEENLKHAAQLVDKIRSIDKFAVLEHKGKIAKKMQNADKIGAFYVVFVGSDEIASGKYKVRNMDDGSEKMLTESELLAL